ncbi:autotransporter secretion outer membrane protein TamA [Pseudomonas sp. SLBN-26]|uniref:autotransporter assembly complex protein TamA n=2 Tax=Pseudomonadaceae TaxID=135621 RepID=UPI00116FA277|nr:MULTISPECIES: autotransporter assembly complex family protein [Pseudomonas]MCP1615880.1 translocation and assembly module TamA [Pseudomonas otitidis]TQL05147.1 autotransporter secretion outer membrane protein TamA [Pseudomonas sp. SLBN-26]
MALALSALCPLALAKASLEVKVSPANAELKANIEAFIGSLGDRDETALRRFRRAAEEQARQAAQALGYYQAEIDSQVRPGKDPVLQLDVQPGEPVRLRQVTVRVEGEAAGLKAFKVPKSKALAPGEPLNHGIYEDAKKLIQSQALRYGFFDGRFRSQRLDIDPRAGVADIELIYDSGPRYALGRVAFDGDTPFDPDLLARLVPFPPNTPYDADQVAKLSQNLQASGYFEEVRVDAQPEPGAGRLIPVKVRLGAVKPRTLGLGVGFSTDVGPRARANWTRHWINPQGHRLGAESEISTARQSVGTWYEIPLDPPLTDSLRFTSGFQREQLTDVESRRFTLGSQWQSKLPDDWQRVVSLRWEQEIYDFGDGSPNGRSSFLIPGIGYSVTRSDNRLDPNQGYHLQLDVRAAKEGVLSDADMTYASAMAKGLYTLPGGHRLLGRVQAGGIATTDYGAIPPSLRFFAGGDQSVRGYDYQTLSPEDRQGNKVGGRYMVVGSAEYQYPIAERWRIAAFVDRGNAVNNLKDKLKTGAGIGVRWVSPVGPIRLDLAKALDDPGGFRIHFSMGPEL